MPAVPCRPDELGRRRLAPDDALPAPAAHAVWRPVWQDGRVVDLTLVRVEGEALRYLSLVPGQSPAMSEMFPDFRLDGRMAAFFAVAETGTPFRSTRRATAGREAGVMAAHRDDGGNVVVQLEPAAPLSDDTSRRDARRWQRLLEDSPLGIAVLTLDGYVLEVNPALLAMLARPPEEVLGVRFHDFAHPQDGTRMDRERLMRTGYATLVKRYVRGDGGELWLRATANLVVEDGEQRMLSI